MLSLILTHPGGAHKDELLACCLLARAYAPQPWKMPYFVYHNLGLRRSFGKNQKRIGKGMGAME